MHAWYFHSQCEISREQKENVLQNQYEVIVLKQQRRCHVRESIYTVDRGGGLPVFPSLTPLFIPTFSFTLRPSLRSEAPTVCQPRRIICIFTSMMSLSLLFRSFCSLVILGGATKVVRVPRFFPAPC